MSKMDPRNDKGDAEKDFLQAIQAQQQIMGAGFGSHDGAIMAGDEVGKEFSPEEEESVVESLSEAFGSIDVWASTTPAQVEMPSIRMPQPEFPEVGDTGSAIDRDELSVEAIRVEMQEMATALPTKELPQLESPPPVGQLPSFLQKYPVPGTSSHRNEDDWSLGVEPPRSPEGMASSVGYATPIPEVIADPPGFPGDMPVSFNMRMQQEFRQDASDVLDDFNNALGDFLREFIEKFTDLTAKVQMLHDVLASEVPSE